MSRRVLVADDEPPARARLVRLVGAIDGFSVAGEAADGLDVVRQVEGSDVEIVLLDIRMPLMDGLQAASRLAQLPAPPAVIFCTAYGEHALAAFEASAVAYLLKPVREEALRAALERAVGLTRAQAAMLDELGGAAPRAHLSARSPGSLALIPLQEICCLLADHKQVTVIYPGGRQVLDRSLRELEAEFPELLVRVHRNALVARGRIRALVREGDGRYCLHLRGTPLRPQVSRRHLPRIRELLGSL